MDDIKVSCSKHKAGTVADALERVIREWELNSPLTEADWEPLPAHDQMYVRELLDALRKVETERTGSYGGVLFGCGSEGGQVSAYPHSAV